MDLELNQDCVKEESSWNVKGRNILIRVSKKDKEQEEWWPRITAEKVKNHFIAIDFDKWVDPDDSGDDKKADAGQGDFDPSMMQGMGGMGGGMPGMGGMGGGMPGMGGMGGMPGMGGAGGMDMASMMAGMGGMGGGAGGMPDMSKMDPAALQ